MNFHDYASVSTQAATPPTDAANNNAYFYPLSNTSPLDTTSTGYIITHQHTPSVVTYSTDTTNTTDTTTIIDTSSYSFSTSVDDQQPNFQHAHNGYSLYQQQQQQQEENGTLALNHIQMASNWQNQAASATPMISTDPNFTTLNTDEELLVPFPERGVAGFVCKLYQSLEAPDGGEKYAHWCQHNGKDMFIIDCIPSKVITLPSLLYIHPPSTPTPHAINMTNAYILDLS
ncbi:hypothetical protein BCR42DRAFT_423231 [Absidia repens]|uniref:Uncharacterized protein n=1 Tax=Absidia repens TaxID=90262 RepID=A0A1X2I5I9_9FUNG|nr:hypothetical protein BCR42DRAFT_423231 [Absidia repens]